MTIAAIARNRMRPALTKRQRTVLRMISTYITRHGYPPTRGDICNAMGFKSPNAATEYLQALSRKGAIELTPHVSRGIRVKKMT